MQNCINQFCVITKHCASFSDDSLVETIAVDCRARTRFTTIASSREGLGEWVVDYGLDFSRTV